MGQTNKQKWLPKQIKTKEYNDTTGFPGPVSLLTYLVWFIARQAHIDWQTLWQEETK